MLPVSVVIICKNAEATIAKTASSALILTDDVIIMDTGSTDNTLQAIQDLPVRIYQNQWLGYGPTKNKAASFAKHPWILSLDADEWIDEKTCAAIKKLEFDNEKIVYEFKRLNYIKQKPLFYGHWGRDKVKRLYNRSFVQWNSEIVHENLIGSDLQILYLKDCIIHHFTALNFQTFIEKQLQYAKLMAERYKASGKKASRARLFVAPIVSFINNYFFRMGFLDGYYGYLSAKAQAQYTFWKYLFLFKK